METIKVKIQDQLELIFDHEISVKDILDSAVLNGLTFKLPILAAKVENEIRELSYRVNNDCVIKFIDLENEDGKKNLYEKCKIYFL